MSTAFLAEVVAALNDETLLKTMRAQLVRSFPSFEGAPPRVRAIRDRLMREVDSAPDLLEALDDLSGLLRRGWTLADDIEVSRALDRAEAALKKARGE